MNRLAGSASGRWTTAIWGAFAAGAGLGVSGGGVAWLAGLLPALIAGAMAAAVLRRATRALLVLAVAAALLTGFVRGATSADSPGPGRIDAHLGARELAVTGVVRDSPAGPGGPTIVDAQRVVDADGDAIVHGGLLAIGANVPVLRAGDTIEVDASGLRTPNLRPGAESLATLERQRVYAVAIAPLVSVVRHGGPSIAGVVATVQQALTTGVDRALPEPQAALVLGICFGIRQPLDAAVRTPLQDAGLVHIVVVSGLKVVMVLGMVGALATVLGWSPKRRVLVALAAAGTYVVLSGAGPAAIRSALMAGGALMAGRGGRRTDPLPMLALAAAAMVGIDPALVGDVGFQLSFLGTAGIVALARPLATRIPGPRLLVEPFAVTVAAQAATVPVMASTFGVIALLGPVANAIVLPLLPALIVVGGAGALAGVAIPALGWPLLQLAGVGAGLTTLVANIVAAIPGAAIRVGSWPVSWTVAELAGLGAAAAVVAAWRTARRGTGVMSPATSRRGPLIALATSAALLASGVGAYAASRPDGRLHVTVLSTGASPAVLVRTADGSLALVDGGLSPQTLIDALGRVLGPTDHRIGLVVVTGGDRVVVAGLAGLGGHYEVGVVIAPQDLNPGALATVRVLQASGASALDPAGRSWTWGGARWSCLAVRAAATERSLCALRVADVSGAALVLGDAGSADQEQIAGVYASRLGADLLVAEPGGALAPGLLAQVRPRAIAVPTAVGTPAAAAASGYAVERTATGGDLRFDGGPDGLAMPSG